ncbi:molybdopterin biosynthesis protein [Desulfovibrio sp. 86]|uniref:Molybdopterin molybdenumtransferase n=1 Tax=uncultured Desulfovibrio sp. TaxID=167968 RepID=A0A212L149_9BACT|nr:molybdopterin biosynthesis protein [Desulfovibrio sp. 86]SCM71099.1 Molybdenum cofactor synthesis domain protein [uncultured Desulfovibrio sp.]VZH32737.1 Molybdenum cofactor synthesis domain protein [Desulfovibrio sp. 86]
MKRNTYLTLLPPDEARSLWFTKLNAHVHSLAEETVPLTQALRRVLSRPVAALRSSPAFHGAAMDGIAVNAEDTFAASARNPLRLELGKAAHWINTGHPLPDGCNAVIMVENVNTETVEGVQWAVIEKAAFPWQHVRKMGEDMVATEIILPPGVCIGPYDLGALAAGGVLEVPVFARPRVAIVPSGSEIVPLSEAREEDLRAGRVLPEFNSLIFSAMITEAGGHPVTLPVVPDEPKAIAAAVMAALGGTGPEAGTGTESGAWSGADASAGAGADLVILNAGSSAGSHDYTAHVLESLGEVLVHGVSVMPGKPTVLAVVRGKPVIGVPGYPVSAGIAMEEFVLPLLALWQKRVAPEREKATAIPCNPLPSRPGMEERLRVKLGRVDGTIIAVPLPRGAGTITSLSRADGIIRIPRDSEGCDAGEPVTVDLLRPQAALDNALLAIGSHDNTLDLLDSLLRKTHPRYRLTSAHVGSLGGLMALGRGQCHLAGSHLLDAASGVYNRKAIEENLEEPVVLLRLVDREQGILTAPGNPLGISGIEDLARQGLRFVNRQRGSGTRVLLDYRLACLGIAPTRITGYRDEEYTHMNVAAAVLSGRADAGLAVRSAANALGLPFVPVGVEEYDLVIPRRFYETPAMQALLDVIRGADFKQEVTALGGYGTEKTGQIIWEYPGR